MKKLYYMEYGCYLQSFGLKIVCNYPEGMSETERIEYLDRWAYDEAIQLTEGWVGSSGFCDEEDQLSDEEINDVVQDALNYYVEPWNEDKHAGKCTYGANSEPDTMEIHI